MSTPDVAVLEAEILAEFPSFKIVKKQDSAFMKFLATFLTSTFMTSFVTTICSTAYVPSDWDSWGAVGQCVVLRHERVHMRQARKWTFPVFAFLYLCMFFPVGLAYARAKFEMEAYAETLAAQKEYGEDYAGDSNRAWLKSMFVQGYYGYMWPFPSAIDAWFDATVSRLNA